MVRYAIVIALGLMIGTSQTAHAQRERGGPRGDDVKKLEDEIAKVKTHLGELEAKLKSARNEAAKKDADKKDADKKDERPGFDRSRFGGGPGFGRFGGFPGREGGRGGPPADGPMVSRIADIEKKLDKLIDEVDTLRRELRRR